MNDRLQDACAQDHAGQPREGRRAGVREARGDQDGREDRQVLDGVLVRAVEPLVRLMLHGPPTNGDTPSGLLATPAAA